MEQLLLPALRRSAPAQPAGPQFDCELWDAALVQLARVDGAVVLGIDEGRGDLAFQSGVDLALDVLERACQAQVLMLSAGRENLHDPHQDVAGKVALQSNAAIMGMLADRLSWPARLRKLDRIDPAYRQ